MLSSFSLKLCILVDCIIELQHHENFVKLIWLNIVIMQIDELCRFQPLIF